MALALTQAAASTFTVTYPKFWSTGDGKTTADMTLTYTTVSDTECMLTLMSTHKIQTSGTPAEQLKPWDLEIPSTVEYDGKTYTVTAIGENFEHNVGNYPLRGIRSIVIPQTVTSIGNRSFNDVRSLTSLDLGGVTSVGNNCFYIMTNLPSIDLSKVTSIGDRSFCNNSVITSLKLPAVESIGQYALSYWSALTNVELSDKLDDFPNGGFFDCPNAHFTLPEDSPMIIIDDVLYSKKEGTNQPDALIKSLNATDVTLPEGLSSIAPSAFTSSSTLKTFNANGQLATIPDDFFSSCSNLTTVSGISNVTEIGEKAFYGCAKLSNLPEMPEVTSVGNQAFDQCTSLTEVPSMPKLVNIGNKAFARCKSLTSVHLGAAITDIPNIPEEGSVSGSNFPFTDCSSLSSFTVDEDNPVYTAIDGVLYKKGEGTEGMTLVKYALGKTGSDSFIVPENVVAVEGYAFSPMPTSIKSLTIGNDVTTIGESCVNSLALTSLTLGRNVTSIGSNAFFNAANLSRVECLSEVPPVCAECGAGNECRTFNNKQTLHHLGLTDVYDNATFVVPRNSESEYKNSYGWKLFKNYEVVSAIEDVTVVPDAVTYRWFNLGGVEVYGDALLPGVYLRVASDGTASKVAIR